MNEFLMKPKIDFAFKEIMADEEARVGFLSAVLKLEPSDIKETRILNTFLRKMHRDDKQGILDVRISMNGNSSDKSELLPVIQFLYDTFPLYYSLLSAQYNIFIEKH